MTNEEVAMGVTSALTGEFFVGQVVRIRDDFPAYELAGKVARVTQILRTGEVRLDDDAVACYRWHTDNLRVVKPEHLK